MRQHVESDPTVLPGLLSRLEGPIHHVCIAVRRQRKRSVRTLDVQSGCMHAKGMEGALAGMSNEPSLDMTRCLFARVLVYPQHGIRVLFVGQLEERDER